jgi:isopenicillin-N N-acyltransferase-like protein
MSIEIITLEGTPEEMGGRHGELLAAGARAMCESRVELCTKAAGGMSRAEILALAGESLPIFAEWAPETYAEFCGIAEGAGVTREELFIGNGYTDFVDLVRRQRPGPSECTHFAACPQACADGKLRVGQTWDMSASAYPHVVAFRRLPAGGPATLTVTTAGCLALIGLNEHGIAVGNTNLTPHDAQPGVMYLAMLHTALAQTSFDAAVRAICDAPRMSGHYYYVAGPAGELAAIETTALRHTPLQPDARGLLAHANHYVDPELVAYVSRDALSKNSTAREARMWELLAATERHGTDSLWACLQDHAAPLCRHEEPDSIARTCAAAVMTPGDRSIRMAKGYPCEAQYVEAALG